MTLPGEFKGCTDTPECTGREAGEDCISEQASDPSEICGDQHLPVDATTRVDLCLYAGRSCRRKEYSLDMTLWEIKENCERELRIPALVVAVAPISLLPLSPLPWSTRLRDLGCKAGGLSKLGVYLLRRADDGENAAESTERGVKLVLRSRRHAGIQTFTEACRSSQTQREDSGCPAKAGYFVSSLEDKVLHPRPYVSADEQLQTLTRNAIVIQKFARRWAARRAVQAMRQRRDLRMQQELQQLQRQQWEAEVRRKRQQQRGDNPVTPADFALLLAEVEAWRRLEAEKILAKGGPPGKRKEALLLLLQQETQLLQRIERLKQQADKDRKKQQQQRLLEKMGAPLIWVQSNGETAAVHTPQTSRARELHSIFNCLSAEPRKLSERLAALAAAREAVGSHVGPLADELRELLAREEALLKRGRRNAFFLYGLRQRISNEFFRLLLDTSFNRQAELVTKTAVL
ncbi:hypothetical protein Esti_000486 [Eimeria stiedai]